MLKPIHPALVAAYDPKRFARLGQEVSGGAWPTFGDPGDESARVAEELWADPAGCVPCALGGLGDEEAQDQVSQKGQEEHHRC